MNVKLDIEAQVGIAIHISSHICIKNIIKKWSELSYNALADFFDVVAVVISLQVILVDF